MVLQHQAIIRCHEKPAGLRMASNNSEKEEAGSTGLSRAKDLLPKTKSDTGNDTGNEQAHALWAYTSTTTTTTFTTALNESRSPPIRYCRPPK